MFACDNVWLWSWLFVVLSEPTSQTFFGWLNHSGGSCSAAAIEAAAVGRGWRQQGTVQHLEFTSSTTEWLQGAVADIGRDELRAMAKAAGLPVKSRHYLISWRTELLICKAFALEEHVKAQD